MVKGFVQTKVNRLKRKEEIDGATEVPEEQGHHGRVLGSQPLWKDKI